MKIKKVQNDARITITTDIFQSGAGYLFIDFGNTSIRLDKDQAMIVADNIRPDLDEKAFNNIYN